MRPRSCLSLEEREARSRLTKLVHDHEWIQGGLVLMKRRCGNPGCKCNRSKKHRSYYLSVRYQGKRKMVYIPGHLEGRIRQWIATYKEISQWMRVISESQSAELIRAKEQGREQIRSRQDSTTTDTILPKAVSARGTARGYR